MAGLNEGSGDVFIAMDDDMQTHPSQISKLIHKMEEGYDLVYGCYPKRKNSFLKNVTSKLNEVSSRILLGRPKDIVSSNFWMITRQIKDEVVKYDSFNPYIDGIFYRTTHKIGNVEVEHFKRAVGCFFRIDSDGARHHRRIPRKDDSDSEPHAAVYCAGNH